MWISSPSPSPGWTEDKVQVTYKHDNTCASRTTPNTG